MEAIFSAFVLLFIVVDPIGDAAIFASLTLRESRDYRRRMAFKSILISFIILILFYLIGDRFLGLLGIGIPAFRITGGILLFLLAIDMVFARASGMRSTTLRDQDESPREDLSVFPLAFPLIAGPGAMTTVLLMASGPQGPWLFSVHLGLIVLILAMTLMTLLLAPRLMRLVGETGANVISRISGLILSALAVQYVLDGLRAVLPLN